MALGRPLYTAYGLSLACDLALPELAPHEGEAEPDVVIERGAALEPGSFESSEESLRASMELATLAFAGAGRFVLRRGRRALVEPEAGASEALLRALVLGPVLALLLMQRGFLVLHASAVALPDARGEWGAAAFVGDSGAGKSTMAAILHARGAPAVADDFIAVAPSSPSGDEAGVWIVPGYARLSLWPDALAAVGGSIEGLATRHAGRPKRLRDVSESFFGRPLPLRAVYVLEAGEDVRVAPLEPARTVVEVARHLLCAGLLEPSARAAQFRRCGDLAGAVPVRVLQRPRDLERLGDVARAIEDDHKTG